MPQIKIDVSQLTDDQKGSVLVRYEGLFEAQTAANNTLIRKVMERAQSWSGSAEADLALILNDWSAFHNGLHAAMKLEIEKILAGGVH